MTLQAFLDAEETKPASEWVCGDVFRRPMPDNAHSSIQQYLMLLIYQFLTRNKLGRVRIEWRCIFGPPDGTRALVPDVTYASFDRMPPGDTRRNCYLRVAPDLAIEVLSRNQHAGRFADKIQFYLAHGVRLIWVFDPIAETVIVFRPGADAETLRPGDRLDGRDVLPGFSASVAEIFAQLIEDGPTG